MFPNLFCHFARPTLEVIKNENKQSASNRKKSIYVGYKWVQMNVEAIKLIQVTEINLTSVRKYRWEYSGVYCNVAVDIRAKEYRPQGMPLKRFRSKHHVLSTLELRVGKQNAPFMTEQ